MQVRSSFPQTDVGLGKQRPEMKSVGEIQNIYIEVKLNDFNTNDGGC